MSWKRFVALSCPHGDKIYKPARRRFFQFCEEFQPHMRIHMGDNWDFRNLRRGVDPREEGDSMDADYAAGLAFIDDFKPNVFLAGNHDWRMWEAQEDARGLVRSFASQAVAEIMAKFASHRTKFLPYDIDKGFFELCGWTFLHGFIHSKYSAHQNALTYGNCMFGHLHRHEVGSSTRREHGSGYGGAMGICVAGLADYQSMNYARRREATRGWSRGFQFGVYNERHGRLISWHAHEINGDWIIPTSL